MKNILLTFSLLLGLSFSVEWYENGARNYSGHYKDGEKQGEWLEWSPNGEVIINIIFKNGKRWDGRFGEKFYIEGSQSEGIQNNYSNGMIREEGSIVSGIKVGHWTFWYETGDRKSTGQYVNGKEHGKWYYWYKSGENEKEGVYANGVKQGKWSGFYYTGNKFFERTYKAGKKHGPWVWWFENGQKKYVGYYKSEKKDGPHVRVRKPEVFMIRIKQSSSSSAETIKRYPWGAGRHI